MDKNAIKKYAVWARNELIERVTQKALQYGFTEKEIVGPNIDSINGKLLTEVEKKQRKALYEKINDKGFEQVIEEVAYTWFNRFCALRFMEVNGYLPSHVRVFTDENNNFKPQIITEAIHLEIEGLDMDKVYELKEMDKTEELYKYLLITQCNALNKILPGMFQRIADYTELLLPDNLLREGSVIQQMIEIIPEEDWKDAVQIIGWLYQYYNVEPKTKVFAKTNGEKVSKDEIPAATQLFTPDWIVRYMVENSIGRLWLEGHPDDTLRAEWDYYLDEAEQDENVQMQLEAIREDYKKIKPEDIRCIDPCMGSGHILAYMFDVLVKIYKAYGYTTREAVTSIVEHNIWGLDIDERAAQLSYFSVMMKARQYDRRFFNRKHENGNLAVLQPHVYAVKESGHTNKEGKCEYEFSRDMLDYFTNGNQNIKDAIDTLVEELFDAKEYGSILNITNVDFDALYTRFAEVNDDVNIYVYPVMNDLLPFVKMAQVLVRKYHVVVTNPPYIGVGGVGAKLSNYVKKNYPYSKTDLFAVFIERCANFTKKNGYQAMITMHSWMFISSYEKLRKDIYNNLDVVNMAHLGARAFEEIAGEVVQTTAFIFRKSNIPNHVGKYERLVEYSSQNEKEKGFLKKSNEYVVKKKNFNLFPGNPYVYWVGSNVIKCFTEYPMLDESYKFREGIHTADNNSFLRVWFEVPYNEIVFGANSESDIDERGRWVPYNKGGRFRKWYGNNEYVIGFDSVYRNQMEQLKGHVRPSQDLYYLEGATWTAVASGKLGLRYYPKGFLFDAGGQVVVGNDVRSCIAMLNTKIYNFFADMLMPTLNYKCGMLKTLPDLRLKDNSEINAKADENIKLSKKDWDAFETSWDFVGHPLVKVKKSKLSDAFEIWTKEARTTYDTVRQNEERINQIYLEYYNLGNEINIEFENKDITIRTAEKERDIKSLISYAVGCMFGRYSLDLEGLAYAGGEWDATKYSTFPADRDNIIPICDDEYFDDDILGCFVKFVEVVYGRETLDENLKFIADALGGKGNPKEVIRNYFLNDFYADHCAVYSVTGSGKRPIYWLFDSGKKNGFKCLIYMHRYQPDTIARIRTDYVHEQQSRYRTAISDLEQRINGASTSDRVKLNKQLTKLKDQESELRSYEEKIHHLADQMITIDLDDGVKVNYAKFQDVLAKIK